MSEEIEQQIRGIDGNKITITVNKKAKTFIMERIEGREHQAVGLFDKDTFTNRLREFKVSDLIIEKTYKEFSVALFDVLNELKPVWFEDLMSNPPGPTPYLIDKLIPEESVVILGGKSGSYKSWLALEISHAIASGQSFLGQYKTTKSGVLYLDFESSRRTVTNRLHVLGKTTDSLRFGVLNYPNLSLNDERLLKPLEDCLEENQDIKLVVVDVFKRMVTGGKVDENEADAISHVLSNCKKVSDAYGVSWLLLHHTRKEVFGNENKDNKAESLRGSSEIMNMADCILFTSKVGNDGEIVLEQVKNKFDEPVRAMRILIEKDDGSGTFRFSYAGEPSPTNKITKVEECAKAVMLWLTTKKERTAKTGIIQTAMMKQKFSETIVKDALSLLEEEKKLKNFAHGQWGFYEDFLKV